MDRIRDGRLLLAVQFNARDSVETLAKQCKLQAGVANYRLTKLKDEGVIRPGLIFNPHSIGLQQFTFYASLVRRDRKHSAILQEAIVGTHWLALVGGAFQVAGSLYARNAAAAATQLEQLTQKLGGTLLRKSISVAVSYAFFRKKYLSPKYQPTAADAIVIGREHGTEQIDNVDREIIHALTRGFGSSEVSLAREISVPRSSVHYRLKQLIDRGIILRQVYHIRSSLFGFSTYRVLLSMASISKSMTSKLFTFAALDLSTTSFHHTIGAWDYDFVVEVKSPQEISQFIDRLAAICDGKIVSLDIVPVIDQTTGKDFLSAA